jgi:ankyrin repeat protein
MSKTALLDALKAFDLAAVQRILRATPQLKQFRSEKGFDLLQLCCSRSTVEDRAAAARQVRLAKWLVGEGFDPKATHTFPAGADGEEHAAEVSLVWFAVARAQNNALARYFIEQGAKTGALWAAAWWGNADIIADLVAHGDNLNPSGGTTPLHMAVAVLDRGIDKRPALAKHRLKTIVEMLRLGADPNQSHYNGQTMLHTALTKGYDVSVLKLLLRHGANPDVPGKDGRTVRAIAARKKDRRYFRAIAAKSPDSTTNS